MKLSHFLAFATATLISLSGPAAFAQSDVEKQRAEIRTTVDKTLTDFYQADPKLKDAVAKAPGYGVFTTYGLSFLLGGSGGKGLVHDNKTMNDTFMSLAQASAGLQIGASQTRYLFVFKDEADSTLKCNDVLMRL